MNDTKHILFNLLNKDILLRLVKKWSVVISIKKICPQSLVRGHSMHDPGPGENLVAMLAMIFFIPVSFNVPI